MPRLQPYKGTSHARLSKLIRDTQTPPLPADVTFAFGVISNVQSPDDFGGTHDVVAVPAIATAMAISDPEVELTYRRPSMEVLKELPVGEIVPFDPITFPTTIHAILPQINEALGLNLVSSEVENTAMPEVPINGITITISESSLAWLPGEYLFTYAPPQLGIQMAFGVDHGIPVDENGRIRVLEDATV